MLPAREVAAPSELQAAEAESVKAAASVQPAASALRALSPRAEAAGVACVQAAQPREAAAVRARGCSRRRWRWRRRTWRRSRSRRWWRRSRTRCCSRRRWRRRWRGPVEALRPVVAAEAAAGRGGAAAGGGGAAGALGAAAGGGAPGGGLLGLPSGPTSSLAWATTSGADCACDVEVASCATVKAVVASSTMRRFVMMSLVPGKRLAATNSLSLTYWTTVNG